MTTPPQEASVITDKTVVCVNFNGAQITLCHRAKVLHQPNATGDSWIFEDLDTGAKHYVSEGCTITVIGDEGGKRG